MTKLQKLNKTTEKKWNKLVKETKTKKTIKNEVRSIGFNMSSWNNKLSQIQL